LFELVPELRFDAVVVRSVWNSAETLATGLAA